MRSILLVLSLLFIPFTFHFPVVSFLSSLRTQTRTHKSHTHSEVYTFLVHRIATMTTIDTSSHFVNFFLSFFLSF
jgi:hypothetical protein